MKALVWLNGKISEPELAKISVFDRGFLFGHGVYEAGRSYEHCFVFLEEHWERLKISASKLNFTVPYSPSLLTEGLFEVASQFKNGNVIFRTIVTAGCIEKVGLDHKPITSPNIMHIVQLLPENLSERFQTGLYLKTSSIIRNMREAQDPSIKSLSYLNSYLALYQTQKEGAQDAILCNKDGYVTEGTTFSIFAVKNNILYTPSLEVGILDSITRRHVIEGAKKFMTVNEGFFPLEEFKNSDEIFAASSIREVMFVNQWDNKQYKKGAVTEKLHALYQEEIKSYLKKGLRF